MASVYVVLTRLSLGVLVLLVSWGLTVAAYAQTPPAPVPIPTDSSARTALIYAALGTTLVGIFTVVPRIIETLGDYRVKMRNAKAVEVEAAKLLEAARVEAAKVIEAARVEAAKLLGSP